MDQLRMLSEAVLQLKDKIHCPICFELLLSPITTKCNHYFCSECYKKLFRSNTSKPCPICNSSISRRSCSKNVGSFVDIVRAGRDLIENLILDTGIDFSLEIIPRTTCEAPCGYGEVVRVKKNDTVVSKERKMKPSMMCDLSVNRKELKQYHRKKDSNLEDSFTFPADYILPKKVQDHKQKMQTESPLRKVKTWLSENEENLKECEELSILNGSLPKSHPLDLNVSSGEEELLSVSQIDPASSKHLAPLKPKSDLDIFQVHPEDDTEKKSKSTDLKDPYEFISSQKSNHGHPLKRRSKRNSKRKHLGLDISNLVNEPYIKKKKLEKYDTSFEVNTSLNDTFDELFASKKSSNVISTRGKESNAKSVETKEAANDVLNIQSQSDPLFISQNSEISQNDFCLGSDEEWTPGKQKKVPRQTLHSKMKKNKPRTSRTTPRRSKTEENEILENLNKTFEEIENFKLLTSSQVMREEMALKENATTTNKDNTKNENSKEIPIVSPVKSHHTDELNENFQNKLPVGSSAKEFTGQLQEDGNDFGKNKNNCAKRPNDKGSLPCSSSASSKTSSTTKGVVEVSNLAVQNINKASMSQQPFQNQAEPSNEKYNLRDNGIFKDDLKPKLPSSPSSPGSPVRYLNVSQSQERAQIMNDIVKFYESSLQEENEQPASSNNNTISVSLGTPPEEDENFALNCIEEISARRLLNPKDDVMTPNINTPVSVVMSDTSHATLKNMGETSSKTETSLDFPNNQKNITVVEPVRETNDTFLNKTNFGEEMSVVPSSRNSIQKKHLDLTKAKPINNNINSDVLKELSVQTIDDQNGNIGRIECPVTCQSKISDEKHQHESIRKGILVVRPTKERDGKLSENDQNVCDDVKKESHEQMSRKVRFSDNPVVKNFSNSTSSQQLVNFFKAGSCSLLISRPKVRFLFMGSCIPQAEKKNEINNWMVVVSKAFPRCNCRNYAESMSSLENSDGSALTSKRNERKQHALQNKTSSSTVSESIKSTIVSFEGNENVSLSNKLIKLTPEQEVTRSIDEAGSQSRKCNENMVSETIVGKEIESPSIANIEFISEKNVNDSMNSISQKEVINRLDKEGNIISSLECSRVVLTELNQNVQQLPGNCEFSDVKRSVVDENEAKSNSKNVTSPEKKISDEDIFKSSENNNMIECCTQNEVVKTSDDLFDSGESTGVLPYQLVKNTNDETCGDKLKLISEENKYFDADVFSSKQTGSEEAHIKRTLSEKTVKNNENSIFVSNVGTCSSEDIFQSESGCPVPPFQENVECSATVLRSNPKEEIKALPGKTDLKEIVKSDDVSKSHKDSLSPKDVCLQSENLFTSETCRQISSQQNFNTDNNQNNNSITELEIQNSNDIKSDKNSHTSPISSLDECQMQMSKKRKHNRRLIESSDESDVEREVKKTHLEPYSEDANRTNTLKENLEDDDDYHLNTEELLQKVMDNINEDLGYTKKEEPKSGSGKKKRIISIDEDESSEDIDHNWQSKSPEYEEVIDLEDEDDLFEDNGTNDLDVIEGTPTKIHENKTSKVTSQEVMKEPKETQECILNKEEEYPDTTRKSVLLADNSPLPKNKAEHKNNGTPKIGLHLKRSQNNDTPGKSPRLKGVSVTAMVESSPKNVIDNINKKQTNALPVSQNNVQGDLLSKTLCAVQQETSKRRMIFVCSGLSGSYLAVVKKFACSIGAGFSDNFTMAMSHLIVNVDENRATPKTLKYLQAVAAKKWVVSFSWVTSCITAKRIVPEDDFEAFDTIGLDGPRRSRLSSDSLLKNVQICFVEPFQNITVDQLQQIFMICGGMVIDSPEGFSIAKRDVLRVIIVGSDEKLDEDLCYKWLYQNRAVTMYCDWLLDCIGTHTIMPITSYLAVKFTKEQVLACGFPEDLLDEEDMEVTCVSEISDIGPLLET